MFMGHIRSVPHERKKIKIGSLEPHKCGLYVLYRVENKSPKYFFWVSCKSQSEFLNSLKSPFSVQMEHKIVSTWELKNTVTKWIHSFLLLIHPKHLRHCDVKFWRLNVRYFHKSVKGTSQLVRIWLYVRLLLKVVAMWCLSVMLYCDVSLKRVQYILFPLGLYNCIFHMSVELDLTMVAIICEKTRGGRGRYRNSDTPGVIFLSAQVSEFSVPFVNNEEVLSTFLCQKVPEQPLSFCPFHFLNIVQYLFDVFFQEHETSRWWLNLF